MRGTSAFGFWWTAALTLPDFEETRDRGTWHLEDVRQKTATSSADSHGQLDIRIDGDAAEVEIAGASFQVCREQRTVRAEAPADYDAGTISHLYLNQLAPLLLDWDGHNVLHGGCVAEEEPGTARTAALWFLGPTGTGKSTLVRAALRDPRAQRRFVSDDVLVVAKAHSETANVGATSEALWRVESGPAEQRLWPDSAEQLLDPTEAVSAARVRARSDKLRIAIPSCDGATRGVNTAFHRLFFLEESRRPSLRQLRGGEALSKLLNVVFRFDATDAQRHRRELRFLSELVEHCDCHALGVPKVYTKVPAVLDLVRAAARHSGETEGARR